MTDQPAALETLKSYFDMALAAPEGAGQSGRRATIAVPLTWPEIKNAEYEVIKRFCRAAENIGSRIIVTTNDGYPIWSSDDAPVDTSRPLGSADVDFMISLHFESPRLIDVPSYYAIWQPVDFYFKFGYEPSVTKLMTHSDGLSCSAGPSDAHVRSLMTQSGQPAPDAFPYMFHSPAGPYHAPAITKDARLFYIGINWERLGDSKKGRFHELLRLLDEADLVDIYGPRVFLGARPWEGFATYRGEIPFDGSSVVRSLHGSGICLAMSSQPHQASGVMSNRLFEGLAAGAVIIANPHPFIDKYFSDLVYQIDDTTTDEDIFFQISNIVTEIRADPDAANERARLGQQRLHDFFSLEKCLQALINQHPARMVARAARRQSRAPVTVIFAYDGQRLSVAQEMIADLQAQVGVALHVILVWSKAFAAGPGRVLIARAQNAFAKVTVINDVYADGSEQVSTGAALHAALPHVDTASFAMVSPGERFFKDHFSSLGRRLEDNAAAHVAASGRLDETYEGPRREQMIRREVAGLAVVTDPKILLAAHPAPQEPGRYLFSTAVLAGLNTAVLPILHGQETTYLLLNALKSGTLEQTGQASYIRILPEAEMVQFSVANLAQQQQFIRDTLRFDPAFASPAFASAAAALAPLAATKAPAVEGLADGLFAPRLFLGDVMDVRATADALKYLDRGFSSAEERGVWIDGTTGTLWFRIADAGAGKDGFGKDEDLELVCVLSGRQSEATGRTQHCTILVNGVTLGYYALPPAATPVVVKLPPELAHAEFLRVRIVADHAEPVLKPDGSVADPRKLGIVLSGLGVMRAAPVLLPELAPDLTYEMCRNGTGRPMLVEGGFPEADLTWLNDGTARLRFRITHKAASMRLVLDMAAVVADTQYEPIELFCQLNDLSGSRFTVVPEPGLYSMAIPVDAMGEEGNCELTLTPSHAARVRGGNRILSVGLRSLQLSTDNEIVLGEHYATVADGPGLQYLKSGFSHPEAGFTWVDGDKAVIEGTFDGSAVGDETVFFVAGIGTRPLSATRNHICKVFANGVLIGTEELLAQGTSLRLALPKAVTEQTSLRIQLELTTPPQQVVDPVTKAVLDKRRLAMHLSSFGLEAAQA